MQHDTSSNKADSDRDKKNESLSSVNKQSKQSDPMRNPNTSGALVVFEPGAAARASTSSRKSGSRNEVCFRIFQTRTILFSYLNFYIHSYSFINALRSK